MREKLFSINERSFAADCIAQGQRQDGRKLTESRAVSVTLGPAWGFADVSFDNSQAVASTVVEAVTPSPDRPNEGILSIAVDLSPGSSEASAREALHRTGPAPFFETRTAVETFVRDSRAIDTEALCILAGVKVWAVRVVVDIISDDGNCTDVAMVATMASLLHARRPDVTVSGNDVRVHTMDERQPLPLPVHHIPLSATFAIFGGVKPNEAETAVLDPTKLEHTASNGTASFAFNAQGEVCGVYKAGGIPLTPLTFANCANAAAQSVISLVAILKRAMADAAEDHPMATARPMLVNPEPMAIVPTSVINAPNEDEMEDGDVPMSTWNATRVPDEAPPPAGMESEHVLGKTDDVEDVEDVMKEAFGGKKSNSRASGRAPRHPVHAKKGEVKQEAAADLESSEEDSDSSDDDLEGALISKKRGKR